MNLAGSVSQTPPRTWAQHLSVRTTYLGDALGVSLSTGPGENSLLLGQETNVYKLPNLAVQWTKAGTQGFYAMVNGRHS